MDRLDEALTIIKLMFTQDRPSFQGKHYSIERGQRLLPIQPGGPKILVGGGGEKRTLRILARHGDIGHWDLSPIEDLKRKKEVFKRHREAESRDPGSVLLTIGVEVALSENEREAKAVLNWIPAAGREAVLTATPPQAAEVLGKYLDAGFGGFTLFNQTLPTIESIGLAGELVRLMRNGQQRYGGVGD